MININREIVKKQGVLLFIGIAMIALDVMASIWYSKVQIGQRSESTSVLIRTQKEDDRYLIEDITALFDGVFNISDEYLPGIICWGDSLTAGTGSQRGGYPAELSKLIDEEICSTFDLSGKVRELNQLVVYPSDYEISVPVINMGVGGEDTNTILGRNGAIPFAVRGDVLIPADQEPVMIDMVSLNGKVVLPLLQGNRGMESVMIHGISGVITIEQNPDNREEYQYYFIRETPGEQNAVDAGTLIETAGSNKYLDYIPIIFIGQNGGYEDINELIFDQRAIINHQQRRDDRFIIIGLHTGTAESRGELENAMLLEYGRQYINLREYMSTDAMSDAGMIPTEDDRNQMAMGMTPTSLLFDDVHFNEEGYRLIGEIIYDRMEELGYFSEVKAAIGTVMQEES